MRKERRRKVERFRVFVMNAYFSVQYIGRSVHRRITATASASQKPLLRRSSALLPASPEEIEQARRYQDHGQQEERHCRAIAEIEIDEADLVERVGQNRRGAARAALRLS